MRIAIDKDDLCVRIGEPRGQPCRQLTGGLNAGQAGTDYHRGEISYDYMNLNCAKTIGAAFKHGAGYGTLLVYDPMPLSWLLPPLAAASANIENLDPLAEGLPVLLERRDAPLNTVMSNSFGFGGTNASVIFKKVP